MFGSPLGPVPELEIQKFLRVGGSFEALEAQYAIKTRAHNRYPELISFKYNQIESPFAEQIVRECRGIVLNGEDNWSVVCRGFDKFFNHGEGHAAQIDWSSARVQEKVDGSLCQLYYYAGEWHVATTGTPDASGPLHDTGGNFAKYFWNTLAQYGADSRSTNYVYLFELCGPQNRVVVVHERPTLTLIGGRYRPDWRECAVSELNGHFPSVPVVREFPLQSWEDIERTFAEMSPLTQEGYVVVDRAFNRTKVKHPGYVALHHAKDGMTSKAFVEIVRDGEVSEVLAAFPEFKPLMDTALDRFDRLRSELEGQYAVISDIPEQKSFALEAVKSKCSAALFCLRAGKVNSIREYLAGMRIENLMSLLGY